MTPPAVRIYEDATTGRRLIQVYQTALGPKVTERIRAKATKYPGGLHDPIYLADYELSLTAQPGELVYKSFGGHNLGSVEPKPGKLPQILSFDFGFDHPTAIIAGQQTPKQLQIYLEHYLPGASARIHKQRLLKQILGLRQFAIFAVQGPGFKPEFQDLASGSAFSHIYQMTDPTSYDNVFKHFTAVGDVTGAGYMAEYAEEPYPISIGPPSREPRWRDKDTLESILDGLFRKLKRCCWYVWPDEQEKCPKCEQVLEFIPGVVIDASCGHLRNEIPAQVTDENGKRKKGVPDHSLDALLYMARYALGMKKTKPEEEVKPPWWLQQPESQEGVDSEDLKMYGDNMSVVRFFQ